ncbi:MAG: DNA repair protein RecO [Clostridia bacterium]|nr:DNA repair protein RecO [Clostridia bacterium]
MRATCDGLVIREAAYGENDRLITVLTAEQGKMLFTAKGARSLRSKTMSVCRLFTYANFEYYEKNGRRWLSGGSVNDSFFGLTENMEGFALASYIVQLAAEITGEDVPCPEVMRMTLNTLYAIEKRLKPYGQLKSAYEIFAANISGFSPELCGCSECGCEQSDRGWWLDVMNGHLVCAACFSESGRSASQLPTTDSLMTANIFLPLDGSALAAWRYVSSAPLKRIFAFGVSDGDSMRALERSAETYITNHLERSFDTLDFYHTVKE